MQRTLVAFAVLVALVGPTVEGAAPLAPEPPASARSFVEGPSARVEWTPANAPRDGFAVYGAGADGRILPLAKVGPNATYAVVPLGYTTYHVTSLLKDLESRAVEAAESTFDGFGSCIEITTQPPGARLVKCRSIDLPRQPIAYQNPLNLLPLHPPQLLP
ncbi:MAG TPA: hypothetical protein VM889_10390 [Candidatus Thermoplasmatota archaeon]|nr:hypothetical protein [Candidatus Thermoplasmatota archaeon]